MRKAFSLCFFVISMMALATLILSPSPDENPVDTSSGVSIMSDEASQNTLRQTASIDPNSSENTSTTNSRAVKEEEQSSLSKKFLNTQLPLSERLDAWTKLHQQEPLPSESLKEIAIAPNPFPSRGREFQREESFRIMALQSLERVVLENPAAMNLVDFVALRAASPVVRQVAQKIKEFAQKGYSYSDAFNEAAMQRKIPD